MDMRKRVAEEIEGARQFRATHPTSPPVKPAKYLREHGLISRLKGLGLKTKQLNAVRFQRDEGDSFREWRVRSSEDWPINLLHEMQVWCTFRWLILDNPPSSPDRDDAWKFVGSYLAEPIYEAGRKQIQNLAAGRQKPNKNREVKADEKALAAFQEWQRRAQGALTTNGVAMTAAERVKKYIKARGQKLRRWDRERIRKLLCLGKIPTS